MLCLMLTLICTGLIFYESPLDKPLYLRYQNITDVDNELISNNEIFNEKQNKAKPTKEKQTITGRQTSKQTHNPANEHSNKADKKGGVGPLRKLAVFRALPEAGSDCCRRLEYCTI